MGVKNTTNIASFSKDTIASRGILWECDDIHEHSHLSIHAEVSEAIMTNAYTADGFLAVILLFICTCTHIRRVKALQPLVLEHQVGFWGIVYKASVIGIKLQIPVALLSIALAGFLLWK